MSEQHDAQTRGSLRQIAMALAHLWLSASKKRNLMGTDASEFCVYARDIDRAMPGKRIRVRIELEDWTP